MLGNGGNDQLETAYSITNNDTAGVTRTNGMNYAKFLF